jgi:hypothetical protein
MPEATKQEFEFVQDILKEKANTDPEFMRLCIAVIDWLNIGLASAFPGKNILATLKGSNAYSLLYRNAVANGFQNISPDLMTIKGDWDTDITKPDDITVDQIDIAIQKILKNISNGFLTGTTASDVKHILDRISNNINTETFTFGGLPHRMEIAYNARDTYNGIQFTRLDIDNPKKKEHFLLFRLVVPFRAIRLSTPPIETSAPVGGNLFFAEMVDIGMDKPQSASYGKKKFPLKITVDPIPPDKTHIYTFGYDDMFLDLHLMSWEDEPSTTSAIAKQPKRRARFAKLLTYLFCRPEFFPLRLPIQNPKFIKKLFDIGTRKPVAERGPSDVCSDRTKISDPSEYSVTQDSNLIESVFRECPPEMLRSYKETFVSTCRSAVLLTPEQDQKISTLYDGLTTAEMCTLLKETFILLTSWYANNYFKAIGIVYLISYMEHKDIKRYHNELECAIKEFDMRHYITMSQNFEAILQLVNEICQTINSRFELVGNTRRISAQIRGGGAFAYHLNTYLKREFPRPGNPQFVGTADLDISIVSNIDTTDPRTADSVLQIFDAYAPQLQALAGVQSDTGVPFPFHYANNLEDNERRVRHVGYDLPSVQVNGFTIPRTTQHFFEFFFYKQAQDLNPPEFINAVTSSGELPYVKIGGVPITFKDNQIIGTLRNIETYKRKKYAARYEILRVMGTGIGLIQNLKRFFDVKVCSANTKALYSRWISQAGLQQYLSEAPVVSPPVAPVPVQPVPVATPVVPAPVAPVPVQPVPVATPFLERVDLVDNRPLMDQLTLQLPRETLPDLPPGFLDRYIPSGPKRGVQRTPYGQVPKQPPIAPNLPAQVPVEQPPIAPKLPAKIPVEPYPLGVLPAFGKPVDLSRPVIKPGETVAAKLILADGTLNITIIPYGKSTSRSNMYMIRISDDDVKRYRIRNQTQYFVEKENELPSKVSVEVLGVKLRGFLTEDYFRAMGSGRRKTHRKRKVSRRRH